MTQHNGLATTEQAPSNPLALVREQYTDDHIKFAMETVAKGATKIEAVMFLARCVATGLDPWDRQIFLIVRGQGDKRQVTMQVAIDGLRSIAENTGEYVGSSEPEFEGDQKIDGKIAPTLARVVVTREIRGKDREFVGVARWSEFYPGDSLGFKWKQMPYHMLGKCAEAQALRKAFPKQLSGFSTHEEARNEDAFVVSTVEREPRTPAQLQASSDEYERLYAEQAENDTKATQQPRTIVDQETGEVIELPADHVVA